MAYKFSGGLIKRVTVQVPDDLHKRLKFLSVDTDTTMQQIFLKAVKMYLHNCVNDSTESNNS